MDAPQPWSARARATYQSLTPARRAGAAASLIVLAGTIAFALHSSDRSSPPGASAPGSNAASERTDAAFVTSTSRATVVVHVAGAVVRPGVVTLAAGARVIDAIDAVGGARRDADVHQLDLAAKAIDGSRIYVPMQGESPPPSVGNAAGDPNASGPINLNTASQSELETLPGIGPTLAQEILATRERLGGFKAIEDLRRVQGIGDRRFELLQPLVVV